MKLSTLYDWSPCVGCMPCNVYCVMDEMEYSDATKLYIDLMMDEFVELATNFDYWIGE